MHAQSTNRNPEFIQMVARRCALSTGPKYCYQTRMWRLLQCTWSALGCQAIDSAGLYVMCVNYLLPSALLSQNNEKVNDIACTTSITILLIGARWAMRYDDMQCRRRYEVKSDRCDVLDGSIHCIAVYNIGEGWSNGTLVIGVGWRRVRWRLVSIIVLYHSKSNVQ